MTKQNMNRKGQATLEEMVQPGSQLILMHDDGTEQPIEEIAKKDDVLHLGTTMRVIEMDKSGLDSELNNIMKMSHVYSQVEPVLRCY